MGIRSQSSTTLAVVLLSLAITAAFLLWFTAVRPRSTNSLHWVRCAVCDATMISEPRSVTYVCGSCGSPLLFKDAP